METQPGISFTELPNPLTSDLDRAGPEEMVELFELCDQELFRGPRDGPPGGVLHPGVLEALVSGVRLLRASLPGRVVLSGAGTSGRLAFLLARAFGPAFQEAGGEVVPLIAGGDLALVKAVEEAEDDVEEARRMTREALGPEGKALFLGITCGFSAPSVGGGLLEAFSRRETAVILLGTNTPERARPVKLDEEGTTLRDLVLRAASSPGASVLAPLVGGEAVTGSTRLKCGSATWILLSALFRRALDGTPERDLAGALAEDLERADGERAGVYGEKEFLAAVLGRGGKALRERKTILYAGKGDPGLAGLLDASECPPTFGAAEDDVRAFLEGGWGELLGPGERADRLERAWPVDLEFCRREYLARLGRGSLPVLLGGPEGMDRAFRKRGLEPVSWEGKTFFQTKLFLNLLSTGAHVLAGKVYGNRMVDLKINNSKLFDRALRIVMDLSGAERERAFRALVGAIHGRDDPSRELLEAPLSEHVRAGSAVERVVPLAVLTAARDLPLARAREILEKNPILRDALAGS